VNANGKTILGFELHITNFLARDITLNRIQVFGNDASVQPVESLQDDSLRSAIIRHGAPAATTDKRIIGGGMRAVVYMWLTFDKPSAVPRSLRHHFLFAVTGADGKVVDRDVEAARIEIPQVAPVVITSPLKGGPWIAGNGPSNTSVHRRAMIPVAGQARISQRFAIDWAKLGDDGKAWHGDPKTNSNWYGYGAELLAVADATVTEVKDGIPENVPLSSEHAVRITLETIGGNHVILALGNGQFAVYAHLQPGSLRVRLGQQVRRGQVLGLLGNSGNSDARHLHFHISNENSPMASEGLPLELDSFNVLGTADLDEVFERGWKVPADAKRDRRQHEMPVENLVVKFD
jgi:murein DD-endopeptidase MepM/ murein hydrolase activator NlpD